MNFCSKCAHPLVFEVPPDDTLPRHVCTGCDTIHYQNPKLVVCTIPYWKNGAETSVLLCKRAIEPRYGLWTLPGGFLENNETTSEGALRETVEESGANVVLRELFSLMNLPTVQQVHLFYLAELQNLAFAPGMETLEARMFAGNEIPWDEIAFTSTRRALELFFADPEKSTREQRLHAVDLMRLVWPL